MLYDFDTASLLVFRKFLEPNKRSTLEIDSDVRDSNMCDSFICRSSSRI